MAGLGAERLSPTFFGPNVGFVTAKRRTLAGSLIREALRDEQRVPEFPHSVIRRRRHTDRRVGFF